MAKGSSGSFRANSLTASDLQAMQNHELRHDHAGHLRSVRKDADGDPISPLIYNPLRMNSLTQARAVHIEGARMNKAARKIARHAFIQFPTDLLITPENEQMMLNQAVAFVNKTHGGKAVFWGRLDRDEAGRHGVDVFFAPKYEKTTKRGTTTWISLTKFGKERAVERFGQKQAEKKNEKTGEFEKVTDKNGDPVMVDCDSKYYQGRAFQDLWFEHLRDNVGLDWVVRGTKKIGRDPDRLEVEEYKLKAEIEAKIATTNEAEQRATQAEERAAERREDLRRWEETLKAREDAVARSEADLAQHAEWVARGASNLQVAMRRAVSGTHDQEITAADMRENPDKFAVLRQFAPDGRPTLGWRSRFWSLNYSDNGAPVAEQHLPTKVRNALSKAFDRVAAWAGEIAAQAGRLTAREQKVAEAEERTQSLLSGAEAEGNRILAEARERAGRVLEKDPQLRSNHFFIELIKDKLREVHGKDGYDRVADGVNAIWATHPENVNRAAEKPRPSQNWSSPSGP